MSKKNSCTADLVFARVSDARHFYFNAPGDGMCQGTTVMKCVEGDKEAAAELVRQAKKARRVKRRSVQTYNVEE